MRLRAGLCGRQAELEELLTGGPATAARGKRERELPPRRPRRDQTLPVRQRPLLCQSHSRRGGAYVSFHHTSVWKGRLTTAASEVRSDHIRSQGRSKS